jgi:hypothetical protein
MAIQKNSWSGINDNDDDGCLVMLYQLQLFFCVQRDKGMNMHDCIYLFVVYLMTLSAAQTIENNELERMWREVVVV